MKTIIFCLLLLPLVAFGQRDLESRYYTITEGTLPVVAIDEDFTLGNLGTAPTLFSELKTFRMNTENYQIPVDMMAALAKKQHFIDREWQGKKTDKKDKSIEFSVRVTGDEYYNDWNSPSYNLRSRRSVYNSLGTPYYYSPLYLNTIRQ